MSDRKNKFIKYWEIIPIALVIAGVFIVGSLYHWYKKQNEILFQERVVNELNNSALQQMVSLDKNLEMHFDIMESIADSLASNVDNLEHVYSMIQSASKQFTWCAVGFIDTEGDLVFLGGEGGIEPGTKGGNLSGESYFISGMKGERDILYKDHTSLTKDPRIITSVPVRKNGRILGVFFISFETRDMSDMLFVSAISGNADVYIMDSNGTILFGSGENKEDYAKYNLEDLYEKSKEEIRSFLDNRVLEESCQCTTVNSRGEEEYLLCRPLMYSDWSLLLVVGRNDSFEEYIGFNKSGTRVLTLLSIAFYTAFIFCALSAVYVIYQRKKTITQIVRQSERFNAVLKDMKEAVYEWSIADNQLVFYDVEMFFELLGETPTNDFSISKCIADKDHEEVNYNAILEAKNQMILNNQSIYVETVYVNHLLKKEIWLRITMNPVKDDNGSIYSMIGSVKDVTEEHLLKPVQPQESLPKEASDSAKKEPPMEMRLAEYTNKELLSVDEFRQMLIGQFHKETNVDVCHAIIKIIFTQKDETAKHESKLLNLEIRNEIHDVIKSCVRYDDPIAQEDTSGFYIALRNMPSVEKIENLCGKIYYSITEDKIISKKIHFNAGITVWPDDGEDFDQLLQRVNFAVSYAKNCGTNNIARYHNEKSNLLDVDRSGKKAGKHHVYVRCFGYFDIFIDGAPLHFTSQKEKELLALLIDRRGGTLSTDEAVTYLWEDRDFDSNTKANYRKVAMRLKNTLEEAGIEEILINNHGVRSINTELITCDYYEYMKGNPDYTSLFLGNYMANYSWAEATLALLTKEDTNN